MTGAGHLRRHDRRADGDRRTVPVRSRAPVGLGIAPQHRFWPLVWAHEGRLALRAGAQASHR